MVLDYDAQNQLMAHACPVCGVVEQFDVANANILKHLPAERATWSMKLGECSGCHSQHFLNLNLPDDHPHPSARHINAMLRHRQQSALPESSLKTTHA